MSLESANKYNYKINPSSTSIITADDGVHKVAGETNALKVNVNNHMAEIKFLILPQKSHDILLGLDWFAATDAGYFPTRNVLKFASSNVYLDEGFKEQVSSLNEHEIDLDQTFEEEGMHEAEFDPHQDVQIKTEFTLDEKNKQKFETEVVPLIKKLYAWKTEDVGKSNIGQITIEMIDKTPIFTQYFRRSEAGNEKIEELVDEYEKAGLIEESKSPYSTPIILIKKKDGGSRPVQDFRRLNQIIKSQVFPMPSIPDIIDSVKGSTLITSIDIKSNTFG